MTYNREAVRTPAGMRFDLDLNVDKQVDLLKFNPNVGELEKLKHEWGRRELREHTCTAIDP